MTLNFKDIFELGTSAAASEYCEWVPVEIDVYIPHLSIKSSLTPLHAFQLYLLLS